MRAQTRMILIGVIAPLVIAAAGIVAALGVIPSLPSPAATHWGPDGRPDAYGSAPFGLVVLAVVVVGYGVLAFAVAHGGHGATVNQRIILAIGPAFATLLSVIIAGSLVIQAGVTAARDVPSILPVVGLGFGLGVGAGVLAWFLLPKASGSVSPQPVSVPAAALGAQERIAWMQRAEPSRFVGGFVITILALAIGVGGTALAFTAPLPVFIVWLVVMLLVGVLSMASLFWKVTIDGRGMIVRSVFGFPRFSVPTANVDNVAVITVNPPVDFGGWGIRWGGRKRIGVITRAGEALEVTRKSGGALVVTVPQPAAGAALLKAVAQRA